MYLAGVSAMASKIVELLDGFDERKEHIVAKFIEKLPEGTVVPGETLEERAKWLITSALTERGIALPVWKGLGERLVGAGLEHVPPSELYAARGAQLERERAGKVEGNEPLEPND